MHVTHTRINGNKKKRKTLLSQLKDDENKRLYNTRNFAYIKGRSGSDMVSTNSSMLSDGTESDDSTYNTTNKPADETMKTLDGWVFETTKYFINKTSCFSMELIELIDQLKGYSFKPIVIPEGLNHDIFHMNTPSKLRYINLITKYRKAEISLFGCVPNLSDIEQFKSVYGGGVGNEWRPLLHFEFLLSSLELVFLSIIRENELSLRTCCGYKTLIVNLTCLAENLVYLLECITNHPWRVRDDHYTRQQG